MTRYHDKFFDKSTSQSKAKLKIYQTYLRPWAAKLGSNPRNRRLVVVDGFAGRGRYKDGSPGSPELAMQLAQDIERERRPYRVQCLFGESRVRNQRALRELIGMFPEASAPLIEDDFWSRIDDVISFVAGDPAILFVDPFGLAGILFDRLVALINGLSKVDLIVNLRTPAAPRLATALSDRISRAVGSADWDVSNISEVFRRNLADACGFLPPAPLQIRERLGGRLHTELVLASRVPDAYELWNDEIVKDIERLEADQIMGESDATRDRNIEIVAQRLAEWATNRPRWRRQDAIDWHVVQHCGDAHTGTIKRAHQSLVGGRFRELDPQARIDDRWYVGV